MQMQLRCNGVCMRQCTQATATLTNQQACRMTDFYQIMESKGYYSSSERLRFYLDSYLFDGVELDGKSVLDIGGGNGLFGFHAMVRGAQRVVVMEPEFDGSSANMIRDFHAIKTLMGEPENIEHTYDLLEDYDRENNTFDIVLIHNAINHIDEQACIDLQDSEAAQATYHRYFEYLEQVCKPGATLIVCDCARRNLFGDLRLPNPFARSIEWEKHQAPQLWSKMLQQHGFSQRSIRWTSFNALGAIGKLLCRNPLIAYLTHSHFRLEMTRTGHAQDRIDQGN